MSDATETIHEGMSYHRETHEINFEKQAEVRVGNTSEDIATVSIDECAGWFDGDGSDFGSADFDTTAGPISANSLSDGNRKVHSTSALLSPPPPDVIFRCSNAESENNIANFENDEPSLRGETVAVADDIIVESVSSSAPTAGAETKLGLLGPTLSRDDYIKSLEKQLMRAKGKVTGVDLTMSVDDVISVSQPHFNSSTVDSQREKLQREAALALESAALLGVETRGSCMAMASDVTTLHVDTVDTRNTEHKGEDALLSHSADIDENHDSTTLIVNSTIQRHKALESRIGSDSAEPAHRVATEAHSHGAHGEHDVISHDPSRLTVQSTTRIRLRNFIRTMSHCLCLRGHIGD